MKIDTCALQGTFQWKSTLREVLTSLIKQVLLIVSNVFLLINRVEEFSLLILQTLGNIGITWNTY